MNDTDYEPTILPTKYVLTGEYGEYLITIAKSDGLYYPLTECCEASATGSMGETCCRECYVVVDTMFGSCWNESEWAELQSKSGDNS